MKNVYSFILLAFVGIGSAFGMYQQGTQVQEIEKPLRILAEKITVQEKRVQRLNQNLRIGLNLLKITGVSDIVILAYYAYMKYSKSREQVTK